jgi:hypothetical protein
MISRATTTITIYRGQTEDEWGDPIDTDTVVETGIPAFITEVNVDHSSEVSLTPRDIRKATCRVGSEVDVQQNDRIYDEKNGQSWTIQYVTRQQNPVMAQDTKLVLQRTT